MPMSSLNINSPYMQAMPPYANAPYYSMAGSAGSIHPMHRQASYMYQPPVPGHLYRHNSSSSVMTPPTPTPKTIPEETFVDEAMSTAQTEEDKSEGRAGLQLISSKFYRALFGYHPNTSIIPPQQTSAMSPPSSSPFSIIYSTNIPSQFTSSSASTSTTASPQDDSSMEKSPSIKDSSSPTAPIPQQPSKKSKESSTATVSTTKKKNIQNVPIIPFSLVSSLANNFKVPEYSIRGKKLSASLPSTGQHPNFLSESFYESWGEDRKNSNPYSTFFLQDSSRKNSIIGERKNSFLFGDRKNSSSFLGSMDLLSGNGLDLALPLLPDQLFSNEKSLNTGINFNNNNNNASSISNNSIRRLSKDLTRPTTCHTTASAIVSTLNPVGRKRSLSQDDIQFNEQPSQSKLKIDESVALAFHLFTAITLEATTGLHTSLLITSTSSLVSIVTSSTSIRVASITTSTMTTIATTTSTSMLSIDKRNYKDEN
eukprot:gene12158-14228_t